MVTHGWVEGMVHASDAQTLGQISASVEGGGWDHLDTVVDVGEGGGVGDVLPDGPRPRTRHGARQLGASLSIPRALLCFFLETHQQCREKLAFCCQEAS